MNLENMTKLADHLDSLPAKRFTMNVWLDRNECGTVGCVAGHAYELMSLDHDRISMQRVISLAQDWLGLLDSQAEMLFVPALRQWGVPVPFPPITAKMAAKALRLIIGGSDIRSAWTTAVRRLIRETRVDICRHSILMCSEFYLNGKHVGDIFRRDKQWLADDKLARTLGGRIDFGRNRRAAESAVRQMLTRAAYGGEGA